MKERKRKKNKVKEMYKNAKKIKCCYCSLKDNCVHRASKEKSENMGITTYCTLTPRK